VTHDRALIYLSTFNFHGNVTIYSHSDVALNAVWPTCWRHAMLVRDDAKLSFVLFQQVDWFKWNASL